ncbi:hypothetical protein QA600_00320 [Natronococcus sp. A-GB1]|uniref:hypothetical protein n=1 Tax=Natronococcus sp. A-GB1 TaxID=3037648 RepID=UPI00241E233F|nr:hypothetical protein [Natronococcus sp. A-GB1]MDG5757788.1 hypothetical protein [Natronococcus sp. A-GB1]
MKPTFEPTDDGLEIIDRIERHRYRLTTHDPVSIDPADTDEIQYPVDSAVRITTDTLTLPTTHYVYVRDETGAMVAEVKPDEQTFLLNGEYTLDLSGPLKLYACVNSSVQVYSDPHQTHIGFNSRVPVILGARSYHTRPARTITTTADPIDIMRAVSTFGSALKTTTPDRSYPTLRGHPPAIEKGNELVIPEGLEQWKTGIEIEIPPTHRHVFIVGPLAYYLGAEVVPGSQPRLTTGTGYSYSLSSQKGFESTVKRVLQQVFFLDCVSRTEGSSPLPLHNRDLIESALEYDIPTIYEQSIGEQVQTYLETPFSTIDPYMPDWQLEIRLNPSPETIEFLPFVSNYLAPIHVQDGDQQDPPGLGDEADAISDFTRSTPTRNPEITRSNEPTSDLHDRPTSVEQRWKGKDGSNIMSTAPLSAFKNNIGRNPRDKPIEIKVVCNDVDMNEEAKSVDRTYGNREELPFDVTLYYNTSTRELEQILEAESDFLHYIGHIDKEGFECSDGRLDGTTIKSSNAKAFLLNACQSHDQGLHLIKAGSLGGIVTFGNVVNSGAVKIGSIIAQLLNRGFPLYGALDVAQEESIMSEQYRMVGDGRTTIAQAETVVPNVCFMQQEDDNTIVEIKMYDSVPAEKGAVFTPHLESVDSYYIVPGSTGQIRVDEKNLRDFLNEGKFPVVINGTVYWSDELDSP